MFKRVVLRPYFHTFHGGPMLCRAVYPYAFGPCTLSCHQLRIICLCIYTLRVEGRGLTCVHLTEKGGGYHGVTYDFFSKHTHMLLLIISLHPSQENGHKLPRYLLMFFETCIYILFLCTRRGQSIIYKMGLCPWGKEPNLGCLKCMASIAMVCITKPITKEDDRSLTFL